MTRPWDSFLTEQDRAHVSLVRQPGRFGFGNKPALLLIDLYRWVYGDEPEPLLESSKKWPGSCGLAGWDALSDTQALLRASRDAGIPVIYSTGSDAPGLVAWSKGSRTRPASGANPEMDERKRRMYDIIPEVAPLADELVIRKSSPSVFWGTPLSGQLIALGVDTILVSGESTSGCVRATVVDGCTERFRMMVVEEAVFDRHQACHAVNLFDMDQKYADVVTLEETLGYLSGLAGGTLAEPALAGAR